MVEKYYREINSNKDIVNFKLQLGAILLKLNEHNLNIRNNDSDIKNNYDICIANKKSLIEVDEQIYANNNNITKINNDNININNSITKINSDIEKINNRNIIKHNYSIENIWFFSIDILNNYIITPLKPVISLFEYEIESKFIVNSILEIRCNIIYKYGNYNRVGLLRHTYSLLDDNNKLIHVHNIIHTNSGDYLANHLTMSDDLHVLFKNNHTDKLKIELQISKVDLNKSGNIGFRIMNSYKNNILCVKHIKYLSEK